MHDSYYTVKVLVLVLLAIFCSNLFLFKSKSLKLQSVFYFFYGYFFWAMLVSSGLRFWLISPTFYEASLANAFAPGWIVFVALYFILAIKKKAKWFEVAVTTSIALSLMLFIQIWTGFIFTCAGYGDCL